LEILQTKIYKVIDNPVIFFLTNHRSHGQREPKIVRFFLPKYSRIQASYDGDIQKLIELVKKGAKVNYIKLQRDKIPQSVFLFDRLQISPLRAAIMGCHPDCLQFLISQGADVNLTHSGKIPDTLKS
jgi:hypothetical protein